MTPAVSDTETTRAQALRARLLVVVAIVAAATHRGAPDILTLAGGLLIAVGAGLIALPAGLIVGGVFLALFGIALDLTRARATGGAS